MKAHWKYFNYVLRHKWFVFRASMLLGVPLWRAIIHDWHKLLPSEWAPYVQTFYSPDGSNRYSETPAFARAWRLHQIRGRHHWQHWLLSWDRGETIALEMDEHFEREMVADWFGAGRAITGKWGAEQWYAKNKSVIQLHPETRKRVERLLTIPASAFPH